MAATSALKVTVTTDNSVAALDAQLKRIEARLGRIQRAMIARPGDTVVLLVPDGLTREQANLIQQQWAAGFSDVKLALVCVPGGSLG